jgi:hypothetical protein
MRWQFWLKVALGAVSVPLLVLTLITREWIELVFGVDPDNGSGALEWGIVCVTGLVAVTSLGWARLDWRKAHPVSG